MQELLQWFEKEQRPLPWRKDYDPYSVWISEVMLQQTQVKTMLPYFERWMATFPNLESLASAPEDQVLKLWEGLGYYSRALNLKKAAQILVNGFPQERDLLLALPGIGPYTAAAIASIAFEKDNAVVDGNVIRVLSRLTGDLENTKLNPQRFWKLAQELLPKGQARQYNQALMELGALICSPKKPQCGSCPLQKKCLAHKKGLIEQIPNLGKRQEKEKIQVSIAVLRRGSEVFIQKRPNTGLMAGLWEFPGGKVEQGESPEEALRRELKEELDVHVDALEHLLTIPHAYTRFQVQLHCFSAEFKGDIPHLKSAVEGRWVPVHELGEFAFPAANLRLIEFLSVLCYNNWI
jgi:A/G-specific adenine glycosylase